MPESDRPVKAVSQCLNNFTEQGYHQAYIVGRQVTFDQAKEASLQRWDQYDQAQRGRKTELKAHVPQNQWVEQGSAPRPKQRENLRHILAALTRWTFLFRDDTHLTVDTILAVAKILKTYAMEQVHFFRER